MAESALPTPASRLPRWLLGTFPLVLLALVVAAFLRLGPLGVFRTTFPPVEELTIERITLPAAGMIRIDVVNGGPEPVTVAQVSVDDAVWSHSLDGSRTIGRLQSRSIVIPYPWVEGEAHAVRLITSTGLTFDGEIPVATKTPDADARYVGTFALLGVYVGVLPVLLGLLWFPFLKTLSRQWLDFFLSLTIGLLVFLGVDALIEAMDAAATVPGAFQGSGLVVLGLLGTPLAINSIGNRGPSDTPSRVSLLIAIAIGLHNLGEGLAVGSAYATGSIALGTFLVLGFLIHNTTEGLGIVAPLSREQPRIRQLVALGLIAGLPTVAGAWIGGFTRSSIMTTLFFAIGAGAVAQVVIVLWRQVTRGEAPRKGGRHVAIGVFAGLLLMYLTGLLVPA